VDRIDLSVIPGGFFEPGDKLLVRVRGDASIEAFDEIHDALAEQFPGVQVVILNAEQVLVYRGGTG